MSTNTNKENTTVIVKPNETGSVIVKTGETFPTRNEVISENVIVKNVKTKHNNGIHYGACFQLDFTHVSREQLLDLAARSVIIDMQIDIRKDNATDIENGESWGSNKYDVNEYYVERAKRNKRSKKSTGEKVADLVASMSDAEKIAMLRNMGLDVSSMTDGKID